MTWQSHPLKSLNLIIYKTSSRRRQILYLYFQKPMIQATLNNVKKYVYLLILLTVMFTALFIDTSLEVKATNFIPPTLGDYPNVIVRLSGNTTITPSNPSSNALSVTGSASSAFKGQISIDSSTGVVQVTNAYPAGNYTITITAFDASSTTTKTFNLAVQNSVFCDNTNFNEAPTFDVVPGNQAVANEDFDGDGKQDIATTNSVLRNITVGVVTTFAPKFDFTSSGAIAVASADFDGDGRKDIVTANFSTPDISVYRNTSSGVGVVSFSTKIDFVVGISPRSIAITDFDGDGRQDIVVANSGSNNVSVLRNISSSAGVISFSAPVNITVGSQPRSVAVGDFDGDGKMDIAAANYNTSNISVLRNTSTNTGAISFASKVDFGVFPGGNPSSLVIADFNGDGKFDIATTNISSNYVSVLVNNSSAAINFASSINFSTGFGGYAIVAKDFDIDGKQDIAIANFYGNTVSALRNISNQGAISFEPRQEFGVSQAPTGMAFGDFNNDGKIDLTVANSKSNNVSVLRNTSNGIGTIRFDARIEYGISAASNPNSIAVGDFDKDGKQDLITANSSSNSISILRNTGNVNGINKFSPNVNIALGTGSNPFWIAVQDFDGDGRQDIVITDSNSSSISVLRNISSTQGIISFAPKLDFAVGANPRFVAVGDFDNDGKFDVAVANFDSSSISVLKNTSSTTGSISFATKIDLAIDSNASSLVLNDFNADGKLDIAVTNRFSTKISVFRNSSANVGAISFTPKVDFSVNSQPLFITSDDFDGDGKPDLAVTNFLEPNGIISILRNISTNGEEINFASKVDFPITSNPEFSLIPGQIVTGDINNDSKADIIVINSALQKISILKNSSSVSETISFEPRVDAFTSVATASLVIGDFNQDGKQDIAFSSYNSNNVGILQNPCTVTRASQFDFDGDGKADVSVFRPSDGLWYLLNSQSGFGYLQFGALGDKLVPSDYDGDGKTDISVFRGDTWFIQRSSLGFTNPQFGQTGDVAVPADYDADGKTDLAVYRPSTGTWFLQRSTLGFTGIQFGIDGDVPMPGDFDGDGKADLALFRPSNGIWYILGSTQGFYGVQFGATGDKLVPADYDGDGKIDLAVFRPSNATWYINRSTLGSTVVQFGISTDVPVPADYDGDGKADIAVYRNDTWFIQRSTAGFTGVQFGGTGDQPVPNAYVR